MNRRHFHFEEKEDSGVEPLQSDSTEEYIKLHISPQDYELHQGKIAEIINTHINANVKIKKERDKFNKRNQFTIYIPKRYSEKIRGLCKAINENIKKTGAQSDAILIVPRADCLLDEPEVKRERVVSSTQAGNWMRRAFYYLSQRCKAVFCGCCKAAYNGIKSCFSNRNIQPQGGSNSQASRTISPQPAESKEITAASTYQIFVIISSGNRFCLSVSRDEKVGEVKEKVRKHFYNNSRLSDLRLLRAESTLQDDATLGDCEIFSNTELTVRI